ncbi:hypothetical protein [Streptomyces sp. NPDC006879]|uniref:hypothetical protein n=1 Tax=Streptomyces sp. NPDC006879 TaxID=3364767 RepID=UPI0036BEB294
MRGPKAVRAVAVALAVTLLAGGCGIRATALVAAGDPAQLDDTAVDVGRGWVLFFIGPDDRLMPVVRPEAEQSDTKMALDALIEGPSETERAAGLRSEVPKPRKGAISILVRGGTSGGVQLQVRLFEKLQGLSKLARRQLVCTAAHSSGLGEARVSVLGLDGELAATPCETGP